MANQESMGEAAYVNAQRNKTSINDIANDTLSKFVPYESVAASIGAFAKPTYENLINSWDTIPNSKFSKRQIGVSSDTTPRPIYAYEINSGAKKVVVWTFVMHGWEWKPTIVALEFFKRMFSGDYPYLTSLTRRYNFVIVPCVNPWGFDNDTRENADGIDINRDAGVLATPEGIALNGLFNEFDKIYQYIDFHAQTDETERESRMNWLPSALRPKGYLQDAMEYTVQQRNRLKQVIDISAYENCFARGILANASPTAGKWKEFLQTEGKIERMATGSEPWNLLADNVFQEVQYTMMVESCITLLDWDRQNYGLEEGFIRTSDPHIATVAKTVSTANRAYLVPIMLQRTTKLSLVKVSIVSGTGNICMGIYDSDLNLLLSRTTAITEAGTKQKEFVIILGAGVYYVALSADTSSINFNATDLGSAALVNTARIDAGYPLPAKAVLNGTNHSTVPLMLFR